MVSIRVLAAAAATLCAALVLLQSPSRAEPQGSVAAPTTFTPPPLRSMRAQDTRATKAPKRGPVTHRAASAGRPVVRGPDRNVMRGPDPIALIARLPWWRSTEMETIRYPDKETVSQVLANADLWLATHVVSNDADEGDGVRTAATVDPDFNDSERFYGEQEPNPIDATEIYVPKPAEESFWQSMLAMVSGVLAAISAGRYLFA